MDRCTNCDWPRRNLEAIYCSRCGTRLSASQVRQSGFSRDDEHRFPIRGVVITVAGAALYFWVHAHSPHMGFGEAISATFTDPNAYYIKEPAYSLIVIIAGLMVLGGVVYIARALIREAKR